jgi:hypothetical protein
MAVPIGTSPRTCSPGPIRRPSREFAFTIPHHPATVAVYLMPGGEGASSHWHVRTARCGAGQAPGCQASPICAHADQVPGCQASPICAHADQAPGCQALPICAHADQAPDCQASPICAHADRSGGPCCSVRRSCWLTCEHQPGRPTACVRVANSPAAPIDVALPEPTPPAAPPLSPSTACRPLDIGQRSVHAGRA